jgi:O-antigen/teichoic acid export membrane protein
MMLQKIFSIRRELAWVIFGQFLAFSGGMVGIKVLTNIMGPEQYGQLALGLTIAGLVNLFVFGPIGQAITRFFSICREKEQLSFYFATGRKILFQASYVLTAVSLISVTACFFLFGQQWAILTACALIFGYATGINNAFISLQNAIRQRRIVALHQGMDMWLRMLLAIVAMLMWGKSGSVALLGFGVGLLLIILSQCYFAFQNRQISDYFLAGSTQNIKTSKVYGDFSNYARSFLYFSAFGAIALYADRWILQGLYGEREVGIYAALYLIANTPVTVLMGLAGQLLLPIVYDQVGDMSCPEKMGRSRKTVRITVFIFAAFMSLLVLIAYLFGEPIVILLSNDEFGSFASSLWVILAGISLFHLGQLLVMQGLAEARPNIYIIPKLLHAFVFLILTFWLAGQYGIHGVGISLCISSFVYLLLILFANFRLTKETDA